jgi:hypothetical protein
MLYIKKKLGFANKIKSIYYKKSILIKIYIYLQKKESISSLDYLIKGKCSWGIKYSNKFLDIV